MPSTIGISANKLQKSTEFYFSFISGVLPVMQGGMSELDAYYTRSRWLERPLFRCMDVFLEKYHW